MNVSVAEVLAGAAVRAVPLSAECAGYLVLAAADQIAAAPRRVDPGDVLLGEDGAIRVASGRAADGDAAEGDLRAVLDALLLRASAPTAGLVRASRRVAGAGVEALVRELETALIPVNRSAARRSLARLERETMRALESGRIEAAEVAASVPLPKGPEARVSSAPVSAPSVSVPAVPDLVLADVVASELAETPASPPEIASRLARATCPSDAPPVLASEPPPPPTKQAVERTEPLVVQERTAVLAKVAPKPQSESKLQNEAELVETRPEPVVKRASLRPPAPPSTPVLPPVSPRTDAPLSSALAALANGEADEAHMEPQRTEPLRLPQPMPSLLSTVAPHLPVAAVVTVDVESHPNVTPILGTRVSVEAAPPSEPAGSAEPSGDEPEPALTESVDPGAVASAVLQMTAPFVDDGDVEIIEVLFDPREHGVMPHAEELLYAQNGDSTEPCPPLELETELGVAEAGPSVAEAGPSVAEAGPSVAEAGPSVAEAELSMDDAVDAAFDAVLIEDADVAPAPQPFAVCSASEQADVTCESDDILSVDISVLCHAAAAIRAEELTPPPRLALPVERPSDVSELLRRLGDAPLAQDDLRAGLKRLAGMEPTPPPPGITYDP